MKPFICLIEITNGKPKVKFSHNGEDWKDGHTFFGVDFDLDLTVSIDSKEIGKYTRTNC
jgi:hypothetical protein